jgi:RND family efflux transporter MFP subunit
MILRSTFPCALALAAIACGRSAPPPAETPEELVIPVAARRAEVGRVRGVLHAGGIVTPAAGAEFLAVAPEAARIIDVTKAEGEAVAAGELLVRLDIPSVNTDVARQRSETARIRADLENARVNQARARDFAERGLIARRELEDADRALADAEAALGRAEAALSAADAAAARAMIRAPFAGVVVSRLRNPGDVVSGAITDPILRIVDARRLEIVASVAATDVSRVLPGASARLAITGDVGAIRLVVASRSGGGAAAQGAMFPVRLTPLEPIPLAVDAPVQVDIDLEEHLNAVLVAPEAVVRDGDKVAVFVASGDRAERREVTTGVIDDRQVEITSGVRGGELVITRGHAGLEDGAIITVDQPALREQSKSKGLP